MAVNDLFKSVVYLGLDDASRRELVDKAMSILAEEIQIWRDEIEVEWDASDIPSNNVLADTPLQFSVWLELRLELSYSKGMVRRTVQYVDFIDDKRLRGVCRSSWSRLLNQHLTQMDEKTQKFLVLTAEG